jgi:DNA-binding NarL/FixJ family response regulator
MRILLADDRPQVRSALRFLLEHEPGLAVVGEARDAGDLLAKVRLCRPEVVLLDWELPEPQASGPTPRSRSPLLSSLRLASPQLSVVALSGRPESSRLALDSGADAFVSKGDPPERLLEVLHALSAGIHRW